MATYLYESKSGEPFCFTNDGKHYYLVSDGSYWAYRVDNYLYAASGGNAVVYQDGKNWYDAKNGRHVYYMTT